MVCAQCGEPSPKRDVFGSLVEDTVVAEPPEDKAMSWPPETKRIKKVVKKKGKR